MKIYLSKLWKGIVAVVFIAIMSNMLMDFLITMVNVIIPKSLSLLRSFLYLAIPVFFVALYTYIRRQNNGEMRRLYQQSLGDAPFSFGTELSKVLKGSDFLAELAAFVTLLLPIILVFGKIGGVLVSVILYPVLFVILDVGIWLLIRGKWAKDRLHMPSAHKQK